MRRVGHRLSCPESAGDASSTATEQCGRPGPHHVRARAAPSTVIRQPCAACRRRMLCPCAGSLGSGDALLWSTQKAKKSRESESSSGHSSDAPDENADGEEPVDAATLEAEVARLRQLVVNARPVSSLLARLRPSLSYVKPLCAYFFCISIFIDACSAGSMNRKPVVGNGACIFFLFPI